MFSYRRHALAYRQLGGLGSVKGISPNRRHRVRDDKRTRQVRAAPEGVVRNTRYVPAYRQRHDGCRVGITGTAVEHGTIRAS